MNVNGLYPNNRKHISERRYHSLSSIEEGVKGNWSRPEANGQLFLIERSDNMETINRLKNQIHDLGKESMKIRRRNIRIEHAGNTSLNVDNRYRLERPEMLVNNDEWKTNAHSLRRGGMRRFICFHQRYVTETNSINNDVVHDEDENNGNHNKHRDDGNERGGEGGGGEEETDVDSTERKLSIDVKERRWDGREICEMHIDNHAKHREVMKSNVYKTQTLQHEHSDQSGRLERESHSNRVAISKKFLKQSSNLINRPPTNHSIVNEEMNEKRFKYLSRKRFDSNRNDFTRNDSNGNISSFLRDNFMSRSLPLTRKEVEKYYQIIRQRYTHPSDRAIHNSTNPPHTLHLKTNNENLSNFRKRSCPPTNIQLLRQRKPLNAYIPPDTTVTLLKPNGIFTHWMKKQEQVHYSFHSCERIDSPDFGGEKKNELVQMSTTLSTNRTDNNNIQIQLTNEHKEKVKEVEMKKTEQISSILPRSLAKIIRTGSTDSGCCDDVDDDAIEENDSYFSNKLSNVRRLNRLNLNDTKCQQSLSVDSNDSDFVNIDDDEEDENDENDIGDQVLVDHLKDDSLLIDCRSFLQFHQSHILNAICVNCADKLTRKRLRTKLTHVIDLIPSVEKKLSFAKSKNIIIYDHSGNDELLSRIHLDNNHHLNRNSSTILQRMKDLDSLLTTVCASINHTPTKLNKWSKDSQNTIKYEMKNIYLLKGGFTSFQSIYPDICVLNRNKLTSNNQQYTTGMPHNNNSNNKSHLLDLKLKSPDKMVRDRITSPSLRCIEKFPISRITKGVYIGNRYDAENMKVLRGHGITHVINVTSDIPCFHIDDIGEHMVILSEKEKCLNERLMMKQINSINDDSSIRYLNIKAEDMFSENLIEYFPQSSDYIEQILHGDDDLIDDNFKESHKKTNRILIHCHAGISRSPTLVIAYLMKHYAMRMKEAYDVVKAARSIICPNLSFLGQLLTLETEIFRDLTKCLTPIVVPSSPRNKSLTKKKFDFTNDENTNVNENIKKIHKKKRKLSKSLTINNLDTTITNKSSNIQLKTGDCNGTIHHVSAVKRERLKTPNIIETKCSPLPTKSSNDKSNTFKFDFVS
ncbi:hypothetical protein SNEBB_004480 [Seison nebaliae]|nr:hypothetical protein SNEBB_004480 [Seison nebaliae]